MKKSKYLQVGLEAVRAAEKIILKYFNNLDSKDVETKEDGSPVTTADKKSEEIIKKIIATAFPDHGFIGEEYGETTTKSEYTWIIDPIDGTLNFSHEIPFFSTEIALFKGSELILGISNAPMIKKLIYAEKGKGAFLNETTKLKVSSISNLKDAYISVGSIKYFATKNRYNKLVEINNDCLGMKGFGDSWSFRFLAEGKLDAVIEAKIKIWDIAAVTLIIKEAGGTVTDLEGNDVTITSKSILASNGLLHNKLLNYLK